MKIRCLFFGALAVTVVVLGWARTPWANQPPVLDTIRDTSITETEPLSLGVSASDSDGDSLVLTAENVPTNATFSDHFDGTGTFNFIPDYDQADTYNVRFIAFDGALADTEIVEILVINKNRAPVVDPIDNREVTVGFNLKFGVSASDPDGTVPILSVISTMPPHATFTDHGDGTGTFDFNPVDADTHRVNFRAFDGSLSGNFEVRIIVRENPDPGVQDSVTLDLVNATRHGNDSIVVSVLVFFDEDNVGSGTIPVYWEPNDYWEYDTAYFISERWIGPSKPAQLFLNSDTLSTADSSGLMISWFNFPNPPSLPGEDTIVNIHFHANESVSNPSGIFRMSYPDWFPFQNKLKFVTTFGDYWDVAGRFVDGIDSATGVFDITGDESGIPETYTLFQNYPNPFNAATQIEFTLRQGGHVKLEIFNILGQKVATLVDEYLTAGLKRTSWDGRDAGGRTVPSGMYFYRLATGDFVEMKKMVLTK